MRTFLPRALLTGGVIAHLSLLNPGCGGESFPPARGPTRQGAGCIAVDRAYGDYNTIYTNYFADGTLGSCARSGCHNDGSTLEGKLRALGQFDVVGDHLKVSDPGASVLRWFNPSAAKPMPLGGNQPTPVPNKTEAEAVAAIESWSKKYAQALGCTCGHELCESAAFVYSCVDVNSSVEHCGVCGHGCASGEVCDSGRCTDTCTQTRCGSACVDPNTTNEHCGGCGIACPAGQSCVNATCAAPVDPCANGGCLHELTITFEDVDDTGYAWLSGWSNPRDPRTAFVCKVDQGAIPRRKTCTIGSSELNGETEGTLVLKLGNGGCGSSRGKISIAVDGDPVWSHQEPDLVRHCDWIYRVALRVNRRTGAVFLTPPRTGKTNPDPCVGPSDCDY